VAKDIRDGDARLCEAAINELLRWVVQANEGINAAAPKFELFEQMEVDEVQAKRDKLLFDAGLRFTPAYWQRVYDLEDGDIAAPEVAATGTGATGRADEPMQGAAAFHSGLKQALATPVNASPADTVTASAARQSTATAFAEPATPAPRPGPTAALDAALATAGDGVLAAWMAQVATLVQAAQSPEALRDVLLGAYGSLPTEQLTQVMALAFAVAELAGMAAVADEAAAGDAGSGFAEPVPGAPDPRIDLLSASVAALQTSVDLLGSKEPLVIHNTIQLPEQVAPVVNFAAPPAVVHVATPAVTVQPAPVTVNNAFAARAVQTVQRDANDEIVSTTTTYQTNPETPTP